MVVFNHTFTADRPVYFPTHWHSRKTQLQLHEEWKSTAEYALYSNLLQLVAAAGWLFIVGLIAIAVRHLKRYPRRHADCTTSTIIIGRSGTTEPSSNSPSSSQ
jgi:hypothetical protein